MKKYIFAGFVALSVASPTLAAGILYDCDINDAERARGWISPKIAIILENDKSVKIVDSMTLTFAKEPVVGTVLRNNAKRLIVKWIVDGVKADNGTSFAGLNYRASIGKSNGKIDVSMIPNGYDTGLGAEGSCKTRIK